jgi:hypothetical protein
MGPDSAGVEYGCERGGELGQIAEFHLDGRVALAEVELEEWAATLLRLHERREAPGDFRPVRMVLSTRPGSVRRCMHLRCVSLEVAEPLGAETARLDDLNHCWMARRRSGGIGLTPLWSSLA